MSDQRETERKTKRGVVVSNKMNKTVVVRIDSTMHHPVYRKVLRRSTKVYAHDESNACQIGDEVMIMETRPLSKLKRWCVVQGPQEGAKGA